MTEQNLILEEYERWASELQRRQEEAARSRVPTPPPVNRWLKPRSSTKTKPSLRRVRTSPLTIAQQFLRRHGSRVQKERDASQESGRLLSDHSMLDDDLPWIYGGGHTIMSFERRFAEIALEYYEKKMDAKFEVVEVLFSNRAMIVVPGFGLDRLWCHVSFTAKPRNAGDGSPKHFFGEMVFNPTKDNYDVNFCSMFNPSDLGNIDGCVFCPANSIFVHPAHGCPALGREKIDNFTGKIQMDASHGQIGGCSKLHPQRPAIFCADEEDVEKYFERVRSIHHGLAEIALEFYEKKMGAEFEMVEFVFIAFKAIVGPGRKGLEEWAHVCFIAKPRSVDADYVSPKYFFGELLKDITTLKYVASYCETFEPTLPREKLKPHQCCFNCKYSTGHGCVICPPCQIHPTVGFRAGLYAVPEFPCFAFDDCLYSP